MGTIVLVFVWALLIVIPLAGAIGIYSAVTDKKCADCGTSLNRVGTGHATTCHSCGHKQPGVGATA